MTVILVGMKVWRRRGQSVELSDRLDEPQSHRGSERAGVRGGGRIER